MRSDSSAEPGPRIEGDGLWLTVVGCSGSASGAGSPASCYLVRAPWQDGVFSLVLDLGPGAFGALTSYVDPAEVGAIGFSHLHADHCGDFGSFHVAAHYSPTAPWPATPVYGPAGTSERLARMYEVDPADVHTFSARWPATRWAPVQQIGPFTVRTARVRHPVEAYAVRVERGPHSLTFSGDTAYCEALVELAGGTGLLLAEAGHPSGVDVPPGVHLTPPEVARVAERSGAEQVVLTHVPPWFDADQAATEAATTLGRSVQTARPGRTIRVRSAPPS